MGKKNPSSPDVVGAAETEGRYSRETARDVTYADRPDQVNPLGSLSWSTRQDIDPATGEPVTRWTQNQSVNPDIQSSLDSSLGMMRGRSDAATTANERGLADVAEGPNWGQFGDPVGFDPTAQRAAAEEASFMKSRNRLDDRFADMRDQTDIRLRNQGLRPGDEAYDAQMKTFMEGQNDAYEQARLQSVASGRDEFGVALQGNERANALRDKRIQEYLAKRGFNLDEADRLQQGSTLKELSGLMTGE